MKIKIPLFLKIAVPLIALLVATVGISGYRVYQESTERLQNDLDVRLDHAAQLVANSVSTETLQLIREPIDTDGEPYSTVLTLLDQVVTTGNLAWIGIYYREGDYLYYWVDYSSTGVGYPFLYATPEHFAAFEDQKPHRVQYTDEYGSYYGFVAPILVADENGESIVLGLVEAVLAAESTQLLQADTLARVWPILVGGIGISVVLSLLIMVFVFNRPLQHLQSGALVLAGGRFGHVIDLHSNDELGELADTFNQMSLQLERLYTERAERERMQRELEIARNVQQALFPDSPPQIRGLEVAAFCKPHRETSGDFYDLLVLSETRLGIVVGDVSGKSIPAAMLMVAAHSTIRSEAFDHESPAHVLTESNVLLCHDVPKGMFVAASYAYVDAESGQMVWANAGQIYPFLLLHIRPERMQEFPRYLETTGAALPLGMSAEVEYDDQPQTLLPGDTVLFYTDGIVEAMNTERELYGFERLEMAVRSLPAGITPQALIDAVLADVAQFVGTAEQHDDMTIVAIRRTMNV